MMNAFNYYIPTQLVFGPGRIAELATLPMPGKKALIVISAGKSMRENGYLAKVQDLLMQNQIESVVFDRVLPNPIRKHVMEGAGLAIQEKCDFVIGLGGGSSIDSAKSMALMATNPGDYWDYISGGTGKALAFQHKPLPVVAITTTAGTGTEVDPWTVITHEERNEKIGFGNNDTYPVLAIVDPELMLSVPPQLTAFQGFDALFHAAEGYIDTIANPISELYSLKSIALLSQYLPVAVNDGQNLDARTQVALANTLSGMVESTSCCTSEHSLAHALSAFFPKLPHGAALIMLCEAYFGFFEGKEPERFAAMAKAIDAPTFVEGLRRLRKACGVDGLKMSDYGITTADLPRLADNARATMGGLFELDRVPLTPTDALEVLKRSYR